MVLGKIYLFFFVSLTESTHTREQIMPKVAVKRILSLEEAADERPFVEC